EGHVKARGGERRYASAVRPDRRHHPGADVGIPAGRVSARLDRPHVCAVALVIAATALLSAINAATLKPTQCALWLGSAVPPQQRNVFYRAFNRAYDRVEQWYGSLIARMVLRSGLMVAAAIALIAATGYWFSRVPTGFLPIEDQGYMITLVQL